MSSQPLMFNCCVPLRKLLCRISFAPNRRIGPLVSAFFLLLLIAASASAAYGQSFGISIPLGLNRPAVDPGGSAIATIDLTSTGGFNSPVSLTCAVASGPATTAPPVCTISPAVATPPANGPSLTITTSNTTAVGLYNFAVTATSGGIIQTLSLNLTVQPLSQDYTLSVSPTSAVPNPVAAGSTATTTVTISPIGSYSGHQITLACLSITPVVVAAPVCTFQPTSGAGPGPVMLTAGPATATLTITTYGPVPTTSLRAPRIFYAFWLALPAVAILGAAATGRRKKGLLGLFALLTIASGLLLLPACGSSSTSTNSPSGQTTPKNTYSFTLTGADENGAGPSNTTTNEATVSVTVN